MVFQVTCRALALDLWCIEFSAQAWSPEGLGLRVQGFLSHKQHVEAHVALFLKAEVFGRPAQEDGCAVRVSAFRAGP